MDSTIFPIFFCALRSALTANPMPGIDTLPSDVIPPLMSLAKKHDLAHLIALALERNALADDTGQEVLQAVYRCGQLDYALEQLCDALEQAQIPFIPLKGSVLRQFYPESWMRLSCDIDILVSPEDAQAAAAYLVEHCGYTLQGTGGHDIALDSPDQTHLELHYRLMGEECSCLSMDVLNQVWNRAVLRPGYRYWWEMPEDFFYFYHIVHMAKHLQYGGCGVRPYLDLWILDQLPQADPVKQDSLLEAGGLLTFAQVCRKLSRVWMEQEAHTPVTAQLEAYLLNGGVCGTLENIVKVQQSKTQGNIRYILSRIFLPYHALKYRYPVLQRHPWLLPVMEVRRWLEFCFGDHRMRAFYELQYLRQISDTDSQQTANLFQQIGL